MNPFQDTVTPMSPVFAEAVNGSNETVPIAPTSPTRMEVDNYHDDDDGADDDGGVDVDDPAPLSVPGGEGELGRIFP